MTVRPLRLGTHGYSWVVLTISIKAVFLPVLCPALLRFVASRRYQDYCYPKNAASAANIRISARSFHNRRSAVFLCSAFLFAAVIERYHCSARRIGEACDDLGRDGLSLDCARSLGMRCGPDTLLKAFERKLAFL
jgi:hypothetical protein